LFKGGPLVLSIVSFELWQTVEGSLDRVWIEDMFEIDVSRFHLAAIVVIFIEGVPKRMNFPVDLVERKIFLHTLLNERHSA
jgi:hypothetical protein